MTVFYNTLYARNSALEGIRARGGFDKRAGLIGNALQRQFNRAVKKKLIYPIITNDGDKLERANAGGVA